MENSKNFVSTKFSIDKKGYKFTNGPAVYGERKFKGGVLLPDGNIMCIPFDYGYIGIYYRKKKKFCSAVGITGPGKFWGGVLAPNGKVIMVPYNYGYIGIYDPMENTFTNGPAVSGANKFWGGVLAPNGKEILMNPYGYGHIGVYDFISNTFTKYKGKTTIFDITPDIRINVASDDCVEEVREMEKQFSDTIRLPNGDIICIPYDYGYIGILTENKKKKGNKND